MDFLLKKILKLQRYAYGERFSMSSFTDTVKDVVPKDNGEYIKLQDVLNLIEEESRKVA